MNISPPNRPGYFRFPQQSPRSQSRVSLSGPLDAQVLHDHPSELALGRVIKTALSRLKVLADIPNNDPVTMWFKLPAATALAAIEGNELSLETSEGACACYSKDVAMKNAEGNVNTAKLDIHTIALDQHNCDIKTVQLYNPADPNVDHRMTVDLTDPVVGVTQSTSADTWPCQLSGATKKIDDETIARTMEECVLRGMSNQQVFETLRDREIYRSQNYFE